MKIEGLDIWVKLRAMFSRWKKIRDWVGYYWFKDVCLGFSWCWDSGVLMNLRIVINVFEEDEGARFIDNIGLGFY